jgi:hypothetical protein
MLHGLFFSPLSGLLEGIEAALDGLQSGEPYLRPKKAKMLGPATSWPANALAQLRASQVKAHAEHAQTLNRLTTAAFVSWRPRDACLLWRDAAPDAVHDLVGRRTLFKPEPLCAVPTRSSRSRAQSRMVDSKSAPAIRETLRARERRLRKTRRTPGMPYGAMPMVPPASQQ